VFTKVRVADVLDLSGSGLTDEQFSYGLKSHFDFVVADEYARGQFAVEFDEPHHPTESNTIRRDRLKAEICDRFDFPLVRIGSSYLQRERRFTLIGYLVEVSQLERSFTEAHESGHIPWDEVFEPALVIADLKEGERPSLDFPYWLERPAPLRFVKAEGEGLVLSRVPDVMVTPWPARDKPDTAAFIEAWAVLELRAGGYVMGQAKLRNFKVLVYALNPRARGARPRRAPQRSSRPRPGMVRTT
jgi:hypothetical protein